MRRKVTYWLIVVAICHVFFVPECFSQNKPPSLPTDEKVSPEYMKPKPYAGRFKVDSIYTVDEFILYYVHCIDTTDLKWGGIFWTVKNYSRIALTIVTSDIPDAIGTPIKIGDTFDLELTPYYGAWSLREHHNHYKEIQHDTLYKNEGSYITIPRDSIWNQLMVSSNIKGKYYCP